MGEEEKTPQPQAAEAKPAAAAEEVVLEKVTDDEFASILTDSWISPFSSSSSEAIFSSDRSPLFFKYFWKRSTGSRLTHSPTSSSVRL